MANGALAEAAAAAAARVLMGSNSLRRRLARGLKLATCSFESEMKVSGRGSGGWKHRRRAGRPLDLFPLRLSSLSATREPVHNGGCAAAAAAVVAASSRILSKMNSYQGGYAKIMKLPFLNAAPRLWRIHFSCGG